MWSFLFHCMKPQKFGFPITENLNTETPSSGGWSTEKKKKRKKNINRRSFSLASYTSKPIFSFKSILYFRVLVFYVMRPHADLQQYRNKRLSIPRQKNTRTPCHPIPGYL